MSVLGAFLSTWSDARSTFGEGTPQPGGSFDRSLALNRFEVDLDQAAPDMCWSGGAANAYGAANTGHQRVIGELGKLDRRLAEQVDESAKIVTGGRRDLDLIRSWVVAAATSMPRTQAGDQMMAPIVQRGLSRLTEVVTRTNGELNTVGGTITAIGSEYQALGHGQRFGNGHPGGEADALRDGGDEVSADDRRKNQIDAFREVFGRDPVGDSDWLTASALDPHSYNAKNQGEPPKVVVARIEPVSGQGVVRTNLFIPSEDVWAPTIDVPPYNNNLGDHRGFSPTAGPEDSRVTIYTDFENGIVVARQNPSVNADTGEVRTGTPSMGAVQQSNGAVLIRYNTADPFSPGGEELAKASGISVNGTIGIAPSEVGPRVGGDDVTTFPALEVYSDRGGTTAPLLQAWPTFFDNAAGPLAGLPFDKDVGDLTVIESFNSVIPQMIQPAPSVSDGPAPVPLTPQMSIVPPGNFTPFGPATEVPTVRVYTPRSGYEFLPGS